MDEPQGEAPHGSQARITFKRAARSRKVDDAAVVQVDPIAPAGRKDPRSAPFAGGRFRIVNGPARFPPGAAWPMEMRADMVAAILDYRSTSALCKAVFAGEAPRPTRVRGSGRKAEVVWSTDSIRVFLDACQVDG